MCWLYRWNGAGYYSVGYWEPAVKSGELHVRNANEMVWYEAQRFTDNPIRDDNALAQARALVSYLNGGEKPKA